MHRFGRNITKWLFVDNAKSSNLVNDTNSPSFNELLSRVEAMGDESLDPWEWDIDRVVQELCTDKRTWPAQSATQKLSDPVNLEAKLRKENINGSTLLTEYIIDNPDFERSKFATDLGIKTTGERSTIKHAIRYFQRRSTGYENFRRTIERSNRKRSHSPEQTLSANKRAKLDGYHVSQAPEIGTSGCVIESDSDVTNNANGVLPPTATETAVDKAYSHFDEQATIIGKVKKRIAPTLISLELDPNRDREIPTEADAVNHFDPHTVEPGVVFRTDDGRKRLIPVSLSDPDDVSRRFQERVRESACPEANPLAPSSQSHEDGKPKELPMSLLCRGYLGKKRLTVDDIFYGDGAMDEASDDEDDFSYVADQDSISNGRRRYVSKRIRHFLMAGTPQTVLRDGKSFSIVQPYPAEFAPLHKSSSITVFQSKKSGEILPTRQPLSGWPEIDQPKKSLGDLLAGPSSYDNWDPDSLLRYTDMDDDVLLPVYGDSDEDNEYDLQTWREMEKEKGTLDKPMITLRRRPLSDEEVSRVIDEAVDTLVVKWRTKKLSRCQDKSFQLWKKCKRDKGFKRYTLREIRDHLDRINNDRLPKMRKEIINLHLTSQLQVRNQAQILETSIFDREERVYTISVLESKIEPVHSLQVRNHIQKPQLDEDEEIVGSNSESDASYDELGNLIDDAEFFSADEQFLDDQDLSANDMASASSNDEGSDGKRRKKSRIFRKIEDENPADWQLSSLEESIDERAKTSSEKTSAQQPEVIDLTMLSSSEAPTPSSKTFIDLVTPTKSRQHSISLDDKIKQPDFKIFLKNEKPLATKEPVDTNSLSPSRDGDTTGSPQVQSRDVDQSEDSDDEEPLSASRRRRTLNTSDQGQISSTEDSVQPRRKRIIENKEARELRELDHVRIAQQTERRQILRSRLGLLGIRNEGEGGSNPIIINEAKSEDQDFIYVNREIAKRIKPHQVDGVRFMWDQIVSTDGTQGCLLAHTMGLGKTMQTITLLVALADAQKDPNEKISSQVPSGFLPWRVLILCPPGLIDNWMDELLIWAPEGLLGDLRKIDASLKTIKSRIDLIDSWFQDGGVLIIGYEMFRALIQNKGSNKREPLNLTSHTKVLKQLQEGPCLVIADEAHKMKNAASGITISANKFKTSSRIALTGSPLANNVEEYHTMIEWVAPNYLGPVAEFRGKYVFPIQDGTYADSTPGQRRKALKMLGVLQQDLAPKVHRADISVLRNDLLPKKEFVIFVPLTPAQYKAYDLYQRLIWQTAQGQVSEDGHLYRTSLWAWLAVLGLLCNHPATFIKKLKDRTHRQVSIEDVNGDSLEDADIQAIHKIGVSKEIIEQETRFFSGIDLEQMNLSNKMVVLDEILTCSAKVGDKVLIFSQNLFTLDYLQQMCEKSHRKWDRLDGKTVVAKRQAMTKKFNTGDTEVFLISTTAGGLGLNLFGANRVVILDFKWNPVHEEQAIGRAYRLGQTKPVYVYRLMTGGTFEEVMHNHIVFKTQLASRVVDKKNPVALAKKLAGDYLFTPKEVEKQDLTEFIGIDPGVLDHILRDNDKFDIRSIVLSDTFERHDNDVLTAEEIKEVEILAADERLKRNDLEGFRKQEARREADRNKRVQEQFARGAKKIQQGRLATEAVVLRTNPNPTINTAMRPALNTPAPLTTPIPSAPPQPTVDAFQLFFSATAIPRFFQRAPPLGTTYVENSEPRSAPFLPEVTQPNLVSPRSLSENRMNTQSEPSNRDANQPDSTDATTSKGAAAVEVD